eukprot:TRINITY_DN9517_c0_g1_i1.p1 TRINITY_DN9517_c0_g1~~TRINITY_DN9517_c0_g1_i1.p1  ORF type:complete len:138 (-),score=1.98 TRINITY_DN9517_c0_g1_i1:36-449(-)
MPANQAHRKIQLFADVMSGNGGSRPSTGRSSASGGDRCSLGTAGRSMSGTLRPPRSLEYSTEYGRGAGNDHSAASRQLARGAMDPSVKADLRAVHFSVGGDRVRYESDVKRAQRLLSLGHQVPWQLRASHVFNGELV